MEKYFFWIVCGDIMAIFFSVYVRLALPKWRSCIFVEAIREVLQRDPSDTPTCWWMGSATKPGRVGLISEECVADPWWECGRHSGGVWLTLVGVWLPLRGSVADTRMEYGRHSGGQWRTLRGSEVDTRVPGGERCGWHPGSVRLTPESVA